VEVIRLIAARQPFHERHAFALDGVGDQHFRTIGDGREVFEDVADGANVVAVGAPDFPAECAKFVLERTQIADRRDGRIGLQLVVIDDGDDLGEAFVRGGLQRFPDLPFLQLPVARHDDDAAATTGEAARTRHAVSLGDSHPQRAGVGGDERRLDVRMAGQAAQPAETMQQVEIEFAERDQQGIEGRRVVALRREVDVRAWPAAIGID
jgi:hypothetical protein